MDQPLHPELHFALAFGDRARRRDAGVNDLLGRDSARLHPLLDLREQGLGDCPHSFQRGGGTLFDSPQRALTCSITTCVVSCSSALCLTISSRIFFFSAFVLANR